MAAALQRKAESGDVKAYEAWEKLTQEIERERLDADGADGPRAWELVTAEQRRALLLTLTHTPPCIDPSAHAQEGDEVQLGEQLRMGDDAQEEEAGRQALVLDEEAGRSA